MALFPAGVRACVVLPLLLAACPRAQAVGVIGDALSDSGFETPTVPARDVIVIAPNAAAFGEELAALEPALGAWGSSVAANDVHVIVLSARGNDASALCIPPPLGTTGDCAQPPQATRNFAHYVLAVGSRAPLCRLLDALANNPTGLDASAQFPRGLAAILRVPAFKTIVVATEDDDACGAFVNGDGDAATLDTNLFALGGGFGSAANRRYRLHVLGGFPAATAGDPSVPYLPAAPVVAASCPSSSSAGAGFQAIARNTAGLRFSSCDTNGYAAILQRILTEVVATSR